MVEATEDDKEIAAELAHALGMTAEEFTSGACDVLVQIAARHRQAGVQQGLDMAAWALEEQAKATPLGHENIQRGASTYNWLMSHARLIRKLGGGDA